MTASAAQNETKHTPPPMTKPTPTPWRLRFALGTYYIEATQGPLTVRPATAHSLDDAAFIVKAANHHEGLVEALREMTLLFKSALLCTTPEIAKDGMAYVRKADALLSKATGV